MNKKLDITLLGKTMSVACPEGQEAALLESAELFNKKLAEIEAKTPAASLLNIALISGLNICFELLSEKNNQDQHSHSIVERLQALCMTMEQGLVK